MNGQKFVLKLISPDGQFQGYLKSISVYYNKIVPINNKFDAKTYAKIETADKDGSLASALTRGGLLYNVEQLM